MIIDEKGFEEQGGYDLGCSIVENIASLLTPQIVRDLENGGSTTPITVLAFKSVCLTLLTGLSMSLEKEKYIGCGTVAGSKKVLEVLVDNFDEMHGRFMKILTLIKVGFMSEPDGEAN
jgi:hypothetical protein